VRKNERVTTISDSMLLKRFQQEGDESSFEALFLRHYDMVYGVLYRLTGTPQEAQDLAQEVFLKLSHRPLKHNDNIAGWLYRVAVNTGYNQLRSNSRRWKREQAAVENTEAPRLTEDEVAARETQRHVRAALAKIKPRDAKLLILREMGFQYNEMAEIVGVAPGSVGTLLARAQKAFEKAYVSTQVNSLSSSQKRV